MAIVFMRDSFDEHERFATSDDFTVAERKLFHTSVIKIHVNRYWCTRNETALPYGKFPGIIVWESEI